MRSAMSEQVLFTYLQHFAGPPTFGPSFPDYEITGPYQFLLKIIWNPALPNYLHWIICSKNKNIWKIREEVSSSIHVT